MNIRERVLSVLNHKKPDVVPWLGDLAYWIAYLNDDHLMPKKYQTNDSFTDKDLIELHKDLSVGFYLQGYFPFETKYDGVKVSHTSKDNLMITEYETPYGTLREVNEYMTKSYCWAIKEHLIKNHLDLKAFEYLYESIYYKPSHDLVKKRSRVIGNQGIHLCYQPKSPFMEMVALRAGIESVIYMQLDAPDQFDTLMKSMERKHDEAAKITLQSSNECIMIPENISSEVVGKTNFEKYMRDYHEKWVTKIKEAGKFSFVHLDGTMKGLISELSSTGFTVLEALTPAPVGDIPIEDLHNWVENETIIWGGLPGVYFTDHIGDQEFDEYVIRVLDVMKKEPRYVLGVADEVPPHASFERIKRVSELVNKYGKYND
ncbi:uroporphyrinogen decarboxylase family protein [Vallitalea okinawensis]|uniref:uroporphyrinogen decarboxylase family protein n=1 Tax=Vallitalea okinawensis TaxID=2078660 RepID=UPI000CFC90C4|nr:uroporphyrinogen decarboxylase family protein [Vallitalea okinawensis]